MVSETTTPVRVGSSYIEWAAIAAGAFAAVALSFVLLSAGAAVGLSLISPYPSQSYGKSAATLATAWALVVTIGSFLVGGYIAGRMRLTWNEGNPHEVVFRDGIHGFLVWSLSIVIGLVLAFSSGSTSTLSGAHARQSSGYAADSGRLLSATVDGMLRGVPGASWQPADANLRDEVGRVLASSVGQGQLAASDKTYLAQIIALRSGAPLPLAEKRADEAFAEAVVTVEKSRKAVVLVGLVTTTALLFGLAAAWYAAQRGGHHRDHNIPARFSIIRRVRIEA